MNNTDRLVLDALKPYMSEMGYALVVSKVGKAGSLANLRDSVAIAELEMAKKRFGSRSEAGRYAAEIRWAKGQAGGAVAPKVEGGGGGVVEVAMVNGKAVEFQVVQKPATDVKIGDLISSRSGKPERVTDIVSIGQNPNRTFVTESIDGSKKWSRQTVAPTKEVKVWREAGKTSGALNTSRLVDNSKIQQRDRDYIDAGKTGPERVKRRNEVIDYYASQGVDVTKPSRIKPQGGSQWLGPAAQ